MGSTQYIETNTLPKTEAALSEAVIRHWHSRHLHSKALVICEAPDVFLKGALKQWRRLMQQAQQERLHTPGADRILTLTYEITHMQHAVLTDESPASAPSAHMWVTMPEPTFSELPTTCRSVYVATKLSQKQRDSLAHALPRYAVVVDYTGDQNWPLAPKAELERKVDEAWDELETFLTARGIDISDLTAGNMKIDAIDNALDVLLDVSGSFLRHAHHFQEVVTLAEPLTLDHEARQEFDVMSLLARRVTLLAPNTYGRSFMQPSGDDTFFMYDKSLHASHQKSIEQALAHHRKAGHQNIVFALERVLLNSAALDHVSR